MASKININLDTSKENYLVAKCKQNDDLTLEASIFENGLALDLTNKTITIQALKSDNTYIIQNTDIVKENNKINAELDRDFSRVPGTTKIEIVLVESSKQNTTFSFYLEVVGSVIRGAVQSSNTATILEALDNKIVEAGVVKEETEQLIESGGAAKKEDIININASLEQNMKESFRYLKSNKNIGVTSNNSLPPIVSFVDDDGQLQVYNRLKDIYLNNQTPLTMAIISGKVGTSGYMNVEQIRELYNKGFEVSCHSKTHSQLQNMSESELREEYEYSLSKFKEWGFKCDTVIYPGGGYNDNVLRVSRDYFKCGRTVDHNGSINKPSLETYKLKIMYIDQVDITLDKCKAKVDEVFANGGWLIFTHHCFFETWTDDRYAMLDSLIKYVKSKNISIKTMSDGYEVYKNLLDIGDSKGGKYFHCGADGKLYYSEDFQNLTVLPQNSVKLTDLPTSFPKKECICHFTFGNTIENFPESKAGTLIIRNSNSSKDFAIQEWHPVYSQAIYKRVMLSDGNWSEFTKIPKFKRYNEVGYAIGTIPANSVLDFNLPITDISATDTIIVTHKGFLQSEISYQGFIYNNNDARLRLRNHSGTSITIDENRKWTITVLK